MRRKEIEHYSLQERLDKELKELDMTPTKGGKEAGGGLERSGERRRTNQN
jgi:hypothetical protein